MSEIKLLPCPFCGGEAKVESTLKDRYRVICKRYRECGATQLYANSKEEAIESWNTRKPMERIIERIENARQKYQRLVKEQGEKEDEAINQKGNLDCFVLYSLADLGCIVVGRDRC